LPLPVRLLPLVRAVEAPRLQQPPPQPMPCLQLQQRHRLRQREPHAVLVVLPLAQRLAVRVLLLAPSLQHSQRVALEALPQPTLHRVMLM
jgi:hypothetical protein